MNLKIVPPAIQIGASIKAYRTQKGLNQQELADLLGVKRNAVACWETERYRPDYDILGKLCSLLEMPPNELFGFKNHPDFNQEEISLIDQYRSLSTGKKAMVRKILNAVSEEDAEEQRSYLKENFSQFYFVPDTAAAGTGDGYDDAEIDLTYLRRQPDHPNAQFVIKVRGHSMEPAYADGALVFVEKTQAVSRGCDVVCYTDDGLVIKRLNDKMQLYSVNPDYPFPKQYEDDHVAIFGKVVGTVSPADYPTSQQLSELTRL